MEMSKGISPFFMLPWNINNKDDLFSQDVCSGFVK